MDCEMKTEAVENLKRFLRVPDMIFFRKVIILGSNEIILS